jgi:hypothetical protein
VVRRAAILTFAVTGWRTREMTTTHNGSTGHGKITKDARGALERVCSGAGLDPPSRYYSPAFTDHVNDMEFHGLAATCLL